MFHSSTLPAWVLVAAIDERKTHEQLPCNTPMHPCSAIEMAILLSVTVSIAADANGKACRRQTTKNKTTNKKQQQQNQNIKKGWGEGEGDWPRHNNKANAGA